MKIVIDIEEGRYNWIMSHASNHPYDYANTTDIVFRKAVESGIVLPKGHGDLIDRDALIQKQFIPNVGFELVDLDNLKTAPTVIPADKEDEE